MKKQKTKIEKVSAKTTPTPPQQPTRLQHLKHLARPWLWFFLGVSLGLFFLVSFGYMYFQHTYANKIYPGITIDGTPFGGKTVAQVNAYFAEKNKRIPNSTITLRHEDLIATTSAQALGVRYDGMLLAQQAQSLGRSADPITNISLILQAYIHGIDLPASYTFSYKNLDAVTKPLSLELHVAPLNAQFSMKNGRATTFQLAKNGQDLDREALKQEIATTATNLAETKQPKNILLTIPVTVIQPTNKDSQELQQMGIKELVASGTSLFEGSIDTRIYNINLASSRLNGVLIPPGATFSFDQSVGDITAATGYKQAYVIENGHTVLGDGGGVCQVSTTMFRAALNAGLPIVERNPHAYRVHYYEEDQPVGIDAAVYYPTVDLKFKNDTPGYLLIQTVIDLQTLRLTFNLYGQNDGRQVEIDHPVILSQTPAPPTLYQDDPTLPVGQMKQIDFSADGANVYFTREVRKNGKIVLSDKFVSNYRPWQAVFLRGTKT